MRTITLRFGPFGWAALRSYAQAAGVSLGEICSRAAAYFESDLVYRRPAARVPNLGPSSNTEALEVELRLPGATWRGLSSEMARQGVPLERGIEHAALYYLAAICSGRLEVCPTRGGEAGEARELSAGP
jgi:hypothetical protein